MKSRISLILLALPVLLAGGPARGGSVIANSALDISAAEVKAIYGGDMQAKNGVHITPVDNLAEQENFLGKVFDSNTTRYQNHWTKVVFREGINPPAIDSTDAEVINFVRQTPGAVGYISGTAPAGVKVVMTY